MFGWNPGQAPNPAQSQVGALLMNDSMHVLSSFELNRIASLTYGDDVCESIFELLEQIQARPLEYTVLTVQKSLVVTKHIMIYGSEKCVNSALCLQRGVEALLEFNTILWSQKLQGAAAFMYKMKGGGVDKGYPVREAAKVVWPLMVDVNKLRTMRNNSADPNSLVPVGSEKVAFLSDDVRHYMLKKRIQEQYVCQTKSNLASAEGGFGSGYASKDGKMVVGAAHGLEEMMKQAERATKKFSDEGEMSNYEMPSLADLPTMTANPTNTPNTTTNNNNTGLLFGGSAPTANPQQGTTAVGDLLDFTAGVSQPQPAMEADLLGTGSTAPTTNRSSDLLGIAGSTMTGIVDPFAAAAPAATENITILLDPSAAPADGLLGLGSTITPSTTTATDPMSLLSLATHDAGKREDPLATTDFLSTPSIMRGEATKKSVMGGSSVMNSNQDPFAALDSLGIPASTILSAKEAENRLLGQTTPNMGIDLSTTSLPTAVTESSAANGAANATLPHTTVPRTGVPSLPEADEPLSGVGFGRLGLCDPTLDMCLAAQPPPQDMGLTGQPTLDMRLGVPMQGLSLSHSSDPLDYSPSTGAGSALKVAQTVQGLNVSSKFGGMEATGGGDDDGFVMGGSIGSGLEPTAAAPAAPPPPPPPPAM